jgi:metal-responsive CopG/Arc/MetJ family transcriptional regulator
MPTEKIAVTIDKDLLERLDHWVAHVGKRSRSRVVQEAIAEKLERVEKSRLARECEKLDPQGERELAELGLAEDLKQWPRY